VLLLMLLGPNTIAGSLGIPVMTIGVKRYTHEGNRGYSFAIFYTIMNSAALTQAGSQAPPPPPPPPLTPPGSSST
jgi:hypothetical protein